MYLVDTDIDTDTLQRYSPKIKGNPKSPLNHMKISWIRRRAAIKVLIAPVAILFCVCVVFDQNKIIGSPKLPSIQNRKLSSILDSPGRSTVSPKQLKLKKILEKARKLQPLRPIDYEQYTMRMNSWRRNEQLIVSLNHHSQCEGVAQIQVIWCDSENEPPDEVANHPSGKVVVEKHTENSLNERFNVLLPTPTLGILSIDDDVLRPCKAIDSGFFKWVQSPDRMVGFDARIHDDSEEKWKYGGLSLSKESNAYSMVLTRFSFLHRDYLEMYISVLPQHILNMVAKNLNCEDIAMDLLVSSLTNGKPPLLADYWAVQSQIKLFQESAISSTDDHRDLRNTCLDQFADTLGLKEGERRLQKEQLFHDSPYQYGAEVDGAEVDGVFVSRGKALMKEIQEWGEPNPSNFKDGKWNEEIKKLKYYAGKEARESGLLEKTVEFEQRWGDQYVRISTGGLVKLGDGWDLLPNGKVKKSKNGSVRSIVRLDPEHERKKYETYE
eukprot:CAMPEP_0195511072 /NCGR_PEP_ID=MMETSP0794_2-20130614/3526_1 /TAXON_ID=515487 /ORGANISM="Stephanopyxis turris, Strain CCMP 815" /LENGTH=494 /DNA_ID=CAMNT_0040638615 /DNA_START=143 /DNA_END=1627 /DNA_ORIENTATION=-